jgi:hypothetical protein
VLGLELPVRLPRSPLLDANNWIANQQKLALNAQKNEVLNRCETPSKGDADEAWRKCNCIPSYQARQLMGGEAYDSQCLGIERAPAAGRFQDRSPGGGTVETGNGLSVVASGCTGNQEMFNGQCVAPCGDGYQRLVDASCRKLPVCESFTDTPFGKSCVKWKDEG